MAPTVSVVIANYNSARTIAETLDSVLAQDYRPLDIVVVDDGSTDDSLQALQPYRESVRVFTQANAGPAAARNTALQHARGELVAFADADDVWLPGKVQRASAALARCGDRPALYGSAQMLVDEALRPLGPTAPWPAGASFQGALTENIITGCTAALNVPAVRLLQRAGAVQGVRFHDWWCYLVISAFGEVVYDDQPTLLYRQHGRNQIGHGAGWWGRQRQIVRFLLRNDWVGILLAQVQALDSHFGTQLPAEARGLLDRYFARSEGGLLPGWPLVFSLRRWRHHWFGELALRILLSAYRLHLWPLPGRRIDTMAGRTAVP